MSVLPSDNEAPRDKTSCRLQQRAAIHPVSAVGCPLSTVDLQQAQSADQGPRQILDVRQLQQEQSLLRILFARPGPSSITLVARSMPKQRRTQRKSKSKSRKKVTPEEGWWSIRAILDERIVNNCIEYLVDWVPDTNTGKTFEPTWSTEVTDEAKAEWEAKKASIAPPPAPVVSTSPTSSHHSQESQPPRPSNWRHLKRVRSTSPSHKSSPNPESDDIEGRPNKRTRIELSATLSDDIVPSLASAASTVSAADTGELDAAIPPSRRNQLSVVIYKDPAFNPLDYQSQSTVQTTSTHSIAEQEGEDERIAISSQLSTRTIPDSQEASGQTWSQNCSHTEASVPLHVPPPVEFDGSSSPGSRHINTSESQAEQGSGQGDTSSNIPSRQPVSTEDQSAASNIITQDHRLSQPLTPAEPSPEEPVYLTQPPLSSEQQNPVLSSSVAPVEATTSEENSSRLLQGQVSEKTSAPNSVLPEDSQAAQIIRRDSPNIEQSNIESTNREAQVLGADHIASLFLYEFNNSFPTQSLTTYAENLSSQADSRRPSRDLIASEMEGSEADRLRAADRRASAVDELRQLCSFDDIIAGLSPSRAENDDPQTQLPSDPASVMHLSSTIEIHSQPLDHQSEHWIPDSMSTNPGLQNHSPTTAPILTQPLMDPTTEGLHDELPSNTLLPGPLDIQQTTVSPADINRLMTGESGTLGALPPLSQGGISPSALDISGESITMAQLPIRQDEEVDSLPSSYSDNAPVEHLITLPFQSRVRPLYDDTILEYRNDIKRFGDIFSSETYTEPDSSLLERIDELLARLQTLCDYPQDFDGTQLANLLPTEQAKYSYDANAKFNFVLELLQSIEKDTNVLIVARSTEILRLLFLLAESAEIECRCDAIGRSVSFVKSVVRLTVALPSEENDATGYDIVIGFDSSYYHSRVAQQLSTMQSRKSPHILLLVTTHSIEHIDLRIPADLTPLERRSALISCIVRARKLTSDPDRGYSEPDEVAKVFSDYFNDPSEPVNWEPVPIPDDVLDVYESLQPQPAEPSTSSDNQDSANKRKLDDDEGGDAKRIRISQLKEPLPDAYEPVLSPEVRRLLDGVSNTAAPNASQSKVSVSVAVLEAIAQQHAGYQHQLEDTNYAAESKRIISGLERQVKEYERTSTRIYEKFRAAVQDRVKAEKEKKAAESALRTSAESARVQLENSRKRIAELEATISRLTIPSGEAGESQPQGDISGQALKEAREKIEALEKKLEYARTQLDFVTTQYQDVRAEATALKSESTGLKSQNEQLQQKASENFARIHQIQAEASAKQYLGQISDLKIRLKETEYELDRARDELRQLKNGRRETRQVSVPRSPRMGMSPRTVRGYGGSTSRGTSPAPGSGTDGAGTTPVPGMQYLTQQTGNGRWNHLRE